MSDSESEDLGDLTKCDRCKNYYDECDSDDVIFQLLYKYEGLEQSKNFCSPDCMHEHDYWLTEFKSKCEKGCPCCNASLIGPGCHICGNTVKVGTKWIKTKLCGDVEDKVVIIYYCSIPCEIRGRKEYTYCCGKCDKVIKKAGTSHKTPKCGKCRVMRYCSRDCQVADWKEHKEVCNDTIEKRKYPLFKDAARFTCASCFKKSVKELKHCAGCKSVYYCSQACQKADWKLTHKKECGEIVSLLAEH